MNAIRYTALEIAKELDRKALLRDTRGDRSLSDHELRPVVDLIAQYLPRRVFIFSWTKEKHLTAERHCRGGDGVEETEVIAPSKDDASAYFSRQYPGAFVLNVREDK